MRAFLLTLGCLTCRCPVQSRILVGLNPWERGIENWDSLELLRALLLGFNPRLERSGNQGRDRGFVAPLRSSHRDATTRFGASSTRKEFIAAALAAATVMQPSSASAKYGDLAKFSGNAEFSAGDSNNECMYATPGTGVCQVFKSSQPPIWRGQDVELTFKKLLVATKAIDALDASIAASKWMAISQTLGASRDFRESIGILIKTSGSRDAATQAKKVFAALDGIQSAANKKDGAAAKSFFDKYTEAMPILIQQLSS